MLIATLPREVGPRSPARAPAHTAAAATAIVKFLQRNEHPHERGPRVRSQ